MTGSHILQKTIRRTMLTVALCLAVSTVHAQTITPTLNLRFGRMIVGPTGGTVTMPSNSNTRTRTGAVTLITGGSIGRGTLTITGGTPGGTVQIILPATVTLTKGVDTLTLVPTLSGATTRTLSGSGGLTTRYGGTVTFPPGVAYGNYSGVMTVTFNFIP